MRRHVMYYTSVGLLIGMVWVVLLAQAETVDATYEKRQHNNEQVRGMPSLPQDQLPPEVQKDSWHLDTVIDWQQGFLDQVLITNNSGGELRLDAKQTEGRFISQPFSTTFALNAVGAFWRAQVPDQTSLLLEVRGRSTPPAQGLESYDQAEQEAGWSTWQPMIAAESRSKADDGAFAIPSVLAFSPDTTFLQFRATFASDVSNASAVLDEITLVYFNTMQGPAAASGLPRVPVLAGPDTLTPRPLLIARTTWSTQRVAAQSSYSRPAGIVLYQIDAAGDAATVLPLLRALMVYQIDVLGWDDMTYHYLVDEAGMLYEGRLGGPASTISRLSGGDNAIHIAVIEQLDAPVSEPAQVTLTKLIAWLCQAYDIDPQDEHAVAMGETYSTHENITAHRMFEPEAPEPGDALLNMLPTLREEADRSAVRARWYFPEGNVDAYRQTLAFFNPSRTEAVVETHIHTENNGMAVSEESLVAAHGHTNLVINDVISPTMSVSAIVEANEPIIVERSMQLPTDINANAGVAELSRIWYFPEGSTDDTFRTYLVLFNPHTVDTEATITYMKGDGRQAEHRVLIGALQRLVVTVNDILPGVGFGTRVIASRPIAAERTMRFGPGESGMHMGPGITTLSRWWFFAEGTTEPPFIMRLLILNPNAQASQTTVTFMTPDGTTLKRNYAIPPTTRLVVDVNEVVPALGIATMVESDRPVAVERALYFDASELELAVGLEETLTVTATAELTATSQMAARMAGTVSAGAIRPAYSWQFAYGTTMDARYYLLLSNPDRSQARVSIECNLSDGSSEMHTVVMPAEARYTFPVHDYYPDESSTSCVVRSTQPIVAERSVYANGQSHGGSTSSGVPGE